MNKPLNLKDNEFIYDIVKQITKGTFVKTLIEDKEESDWVEEDDSFNVQNSSLISNTIEEIN